jgi:rubrerythrin
MKEMTEKWWHECLNNKEKLEHWLVSLYNNEKDAEERFLSFANEYCSDDPEAYAIFTIIAEQERNHAVLVDKILQNRIIEKH